MQRPQSEVGWGRFPDKLERGRQTGQGRFQSERRIPVFACDSGFNERKKWSVPEIYEQTNFKTESIYLDRTFGGDSHHRHTGEPVVADPGEGQGSRETGQLRFQPQAVESGPSDIRVG